MNLERPMTIRRYAEMAQKTSSVTSPDEKLRHGIMGLSGEAGEIMDVLKKHRYMGLTNKLTKDKLTLEAGDLLWYVIETCVGAGLNAEKIAADAMANALARKKLNRAVGEYRAAASICWEAAKLNHMQADHPYRPMEERVAVVTILTEIMTSLFLLAESNEISMQTVMHANIDKLRERYGEKFDVMKSNARYM